MDRIPEIAIGLPVYNGERYLAVAIESVLRQTYTDFELIISDNASTDSTWEICSAYAARDDRIRLCRNETNLGAISNFDLVFRQARGNYFMWMAHDDVLGENCLAACHDFLSTRQDYAMCFPYTIFIDENGREFYGLYGCHSADDAELLPRYAQCITDMMLAYAVYGLFRRKELEEIISLMTDLPLQQYSDQRFVCAFALHGKIKRLDGVYRYFRCHAEQSSSPMAGTVRLWRSLGGPKTVIPLMPWKNYYLNHIRQIIYSKVAVTQKWKLVLLVLSDVRLARLKEDVVHFGRVISIGRPLLNRLLRRLWHAVRNKPRST